VPIAIVLNSHCQSAD